MELSEQINVEITEELKGEEEIPLEIKDYSSSSNEWENLISKIENQFLQWNIAQNQEIQIKTAKSAVLDFPIFDKESLGPEERKAAEFNYRKRNNEK